MRIQLDHIAFGVPVLAAAAAFVAGRLGGVADQGGPAPGYTGGQWSFARGERLEVLEPDGSPTSFMQRFVDRHGAGVHHVTFKVPDLRAVCDRAEARGYRIVGYNDAHPGWQEAFLHPKQAQGIVIQFARSAPDPEHTGGWADAKWAPPAPAHPPPPVQILGLRLRAHDAKRARRQWGEVCGGEEQDPLVFAWPDSPLRLSVEVDADRPEGPLHIEVASDRPLDLPDGPVSSLGARFVLSQGGLSAPMSG